MQELFPTLELAWQHQDWETAAFWSERMRELLKNMDKLRLEGSDTTTYHIKWLLTWVDLPLAGLYHYRERKLDEAVEILEEIQDCAKQKLATSADMELEFSSKDYQIPLAALEYERSCSVQNDENEKEKNDCIRKWARAYCTDKLIVEQDLCFWLYLAIIAMEISSML